MRIELVVDVPGVHNPDAIDAITYGNEVVRLVRNDTGDITASLIHAAVGSDIGVPSDYDASHPVLTVEHTDIVHDPSAITPHNEAAPATEVTAETAVVEAPAVETAVPVETPEEQARDQLGTQD